MMKRIKLLAAITLCCALSSKGQVVYGVDEKDHVSSIGVSAVAETQPSSSITVPQRDGYKMSKIGDNWFISTNLGISAFIGQPKGCGDLFDRNLLSAMFTLGKWHTPYFGTRVAIQGFKFYNANLLKQSYQNYRVDLMLNASSFFHPDHSSPSKWNVYPYIGGGAVRNSDTKKQFFGLSYGIGTNYRLSERINLSAELGGCSTFQDFDGIGKHRHFGDDFLHAVVGITIDMGKLGWDKRKKNEKYLSYTTTQYNTISIPRNNYSGLNALRKRVSETDSVRHGNIELNVPILFFFKINSTKLVDNQQIVNIKEIAGVVKENGLKVRIIGAADSKTGTKAINRQLSIKRAKYIAKLLIKEGVPKSSMTGVSRGGIDLYKPSTANRHACVIVYSEK